MYSFSLQIFLFFFSFSVHIRLFLKAQSHSLFGEARDKMREREPLVDKIFFLKKAFKKITCKVYLGELIQGISLASNVFWLLRVAGATVCFLEQSEKPLQSNVLHCAGRKLMSPQATVAFFKKTFFFNLNYTDPIPKKLELCPSTTFLLLIQFRITL